jgi:phenylacetate-coenzyme A ligase PaaK-like adenylate-forming protein
MSKLFFQTVFRLAGVTKLYREIVQQERLTNIHFHIRQDLEKLLTAANQHNPYFQGKFSEFLSANENVDDRSFFQAYSRLPAMTKQDYAQAGQSIMAGNLAKANTSELELQFEGKPIRTLRRLRSGDFLMPMATGGSTSLPLVVHMTKHHMFSMLFTFFKCWYRMGWRPGEKMMIFYPKNTYNIDEMVKFNRFSWLTGFRYHLFDHVDDNTVREFVDDINRFRPKLLLVFPSPMNMIAHTIRKLNLPLRHQPELINVSGETFFDCQRRNIESVFTRSKIEDSYGSVELGEIAHETNGGLEVFANVAYIETEKNDAGQPEMIVTRLHLTDFPFIRYRMKDLAEIEILQDESGNERQVITRIEGKDSNYIMSDRGERFYPSFFNQFVNQLNSIFDGAILEIKVYERSQRELEVQFIVRESRHQVAIAQETQRQLAARISNQMRFEVRFVDFIDHDYRRKYRVIERVGDVEFAGGMVGDFNKSSTVNEIELEVGRRSLDRSFLSSRN